MNPAYSSALALGYFAALVGWWLLSKKFSALWEEVPPPPFAHPWREVAYALAAGVAVVGVGQLYQRGVRLELPGRWAPLAEALDQLAIFAPMLILLLVRRHAPSTAWLRTNRLGWRLLIGLVLALAAILVFTGVHADAHGVFAVVPRVFAWRHFGELVQVILEDISIAILLVRFAAATRPWIAVVLVAALFAAGHVPAMLAGGAGASELVGLVRDFALGAAIIAVLQRSADVAWFAVLHFAMDMMQFESGARL